MGDAAVKDLHRVRVERVVDADREVVEKVREVRVVERLGQRRALELADLSVHRLDDAYHVLADAADGEPLDVPRPSHQNVDAAVRLHLEVVMRAEELITVDPFEFRVSTELHEAPWVRRDAQNAPVRVGPRPDPVIRTILMPRVKDIPLHIDEKRSRVVAGDQHRIALVRLRPAHRDAVRLWGVVSSGHVPQRRDPFDLPEFLLREPVGAGLRHGERGHQNDGQSQRDDGGSHGSPDQCCRQSALRSGHWSRDTE